MNNEHIGLANTSLKNNSKLYIKTCMQDNIGKNDTSNYCEAPGVIGKSSCMPFNHLTNPTTIANQSDHLITALTLLTIIVSLIPP